MPASKENTVVPRGANSMIYAIASLLPILLHVLKQSYFLSSIQSNIVEIDC